MNVVYAKKQGRECALDAVITWDNTYLTGCNNMRSVLDNFDYIFLN